MLADVGHAPHGGCWFPAAHSAWPHWRQTPHRRWLREDVLAWEAERERAELHALEHAQPEIGSAAT